MNRRRILLGSALLLAAVGAARADTLVYADGTRRDGTVLRVAFVAGDLPAVYAGKVVALVTLSPEGDDLLYLQPGGARRGRLTSVRFEADGQTSDVARDKLRSILITPRDEPTSKKPTRKPSPADEAAAAEKEARAKIARYNLSLRNHFWDSAADLKKKDYDVLKAAFMDQARAVANDIDRLNRSIRDKERRRDEAERRWRRDRAEAQRRRKDGQGWGDPRRPTFNDGLDRDKQALRDAEARKRKLQAVINREKAKIASAINVTRKRVVSVYAKFKIALEKGEDLSPDALRKRYQAAHDAHQTYGKKP